MSYYHDDYDSAYYGNGSDSDSNGYTDYDEDEDCSYDLGVWTTDPLSAPSSPLPAVSAPLAPESPMSPNASPISFYEYGSSNVVLSSTPPAENPRFRKVPSSDDVPEYSWLVLDAAPTRVRSAAAVPAVPDTASVITPSFAWVWLDLLC